MAVWYVARVRLRDHGRSWATIVMVIAIVSAAVMILTAGGRRAQTVYPRFLKAAHAPDVIVAGGAATGLADIDLARIAALPQVAESASVLNYFSLGRTGAGQIMPQRMFAAQVADSRVFAGPLDRVKIVAGRRARPDRPDEMVVDFSFEKSYGIRVGTTVTVRFATPDGLPRLFAANNDTPPEALEIGPLTTFRVVGLGAIPGQFPPLVSAGLPSLWMTPTWAQAYASQLASSSGIGVRLRHGDADVNAFKSEVEQMAGGKPVRFFTGRDSTATVQASFGSQAVSLYILSGLLALVAIIFVGQAFAREASAQSSGVALAALGMSRRQRTGVFALQGLLAGLAAGTVAVIAAFALSPVMPLGVARVADPSPGLSLDGLVLAGGLVLTAIVTGSLAALQGWRAEQPAEHFARPTGVRTSQPVINWLPLGTLVGVGFALRSERGRDSHSSGAALTGIGLGLLTLTATVVFGASLTHLVSTPHLWGATWQGRVGNGFNRDEEGKVQSKLEADPWVHDLAAGTAAQLQLDDRVRVDAFAMNEIRGHVAPLVLVGRAPTAADEIFVGTASLRSLGAHIGDQVTVSVGPVSARMRIVGRGPIPLGAFRDAGHSAWITFDTFKTLVPNAQPDLYLVNGPTGTTPSAADAYLARNHSGIGVFPHELPTDFANFGRVQRLPLIMGFILATLAGLTLVHALVMASRARRRELAILKTLGFVRRQVAEAVFSQATCLVAAAALIAVPLGVLVGRWSWKVFADRLGALAVPVIPARQVVAIVAGGLLIALVAAAGPAWAASRVKPAVIFRVE